LSLQFFEIYKLTPIPIFKFGLKKIKIYKSCQKMMTMKFFIIAFV